MARYRYRVLAVGVVSGLLLPGAVACGGDEDGCSWRGDAVEWWHTTAPDSALGELWDDLCDEYHNASRYLEGFVGVNATFQPTDTFTESLADAMQAGEPPDMFQSSGGNALRQYVRAGLVRDLTDDLSDVIAKITPGALAPYQVDGRVYGIPWSMGMIGIWYNRELFAQAGINKEPTTWSEFLEAVRRLQADLWKFAGVLEYLSCRCRRWCPTRGSMAGQHGAGPRDLAGCA